MWNSEKSLKLSLILTYMFIILLFAGAVIMPWAVTWYVEIRHRSASLAATIMVTCYPCVPFIAISLFSLRKLLKNAASGIVFTTENVNLLHRISWCCMFTAVVTLIAGYFYMPFYITGIIAAFSGLIIRVIKSLFTAAIPKE